MKIYLIPFLLLCLFSQLAFSQTTPATQNSDVSHFWESDDHKFPLILSADVGFSNRGLPISLNADFGILQDISIGPTISYQSHKPSSTFLITRHTLIGIGVKGNYHLRRLLDLRDSYDLYAGLKMRYINWSVKSGSQQVSNDGLPTFDIALTVGFRYLVNSQIGIYAEAGMGIVASSGSFGISFKLW
jgi:hypothetical protein